jgi:cytochrome bd-type quinol oxidase subunit 2
MRRMLQTVVNLVLQIQRDEPCDERALRHRDRELGRSLTHLAGTPVRQLTVWLQRVSVEEDRDKARDAARALRLVTIVLVVLGCVSGSGAAAAAFYYDGQHPINILPVLAVFVVLPVVMLASCPAVPASHCIL